MHERGLVGGNTAWGSMIRTTWADGASRSHYQWVNPGGLGLGVRRQTRGPSSVALPGAIEANLQARTTIRLNTSWPGPPMAGHVCQSVGGLWVKTCTSGVEPVILTVGLKSSVGLPGPRSRKFKKTAPENLLHEIVRKVFPSTR